MVDSNGCQSVSAEEMSQVRGGGQQEEKVLEGSGLPCLTALPDPSLCEPGLLSNGWDGRVHQGVGFDE